MENEPNKPIFILNTSWVCRATLEFDYRLGRVGLELGWVWDGIRLGWGSGKNLGPDKDLGPDKNLVPNVSGGWGGNYHYTNAHSGPNNRFLQQGRVWQKVVIIVLFLFYFCLHIFSMLLVRRSDRN